MPRIDRLIAHNTGLSRKDITRAFRAGGVRDAAGERLDDPRWSLPPSALPFGVQWYGEPLTLYLHYAVLQHKPLGVVTAMADPRHRTAFDLLPADLPLRRDLRAVGRLDKETSGLLLWTSDGDLLHRITHPRYAVPRRYHAALTSEFRDPPDDFALEDGYRPSITALSRADASQMHVSLHRPHTAQTFADITVTSGRFHEVRRIFAALGSHVEGLCRVAYGPIELPPDLPPEHCNPVDLKAHFRDLHPVPAGER